jgi:hypothetical protein
MDKTAPPKPAVPLGLLPPPPPQVLNSIVAGLSNVIVWVTPVLDDPVNVIGESANNTPGAPGIVVVYVIKVGPEDPPPNPNLNPVKIGAIFTSYQRNPPFLVA